MMDVNIVNMTMPHFFWGGGVLCKDKFEQYPWQFHQMEKYFDLH